jgi:flagellar biosynthetic protein FliQ
MPYDENLVYLVRQTLIVSMKISLPILGAGVLIGLVISILQSITSVQDQTLTFVPKIIGMVMVAVVLMPWIVTRLVEFAAQLLFSGL